MDDKIGKIEKYLSGEMSLQEKLEFEDLIQTDPILKQEFDLRNEINQAILEEDVMDLRNSLDQIYKSTRNRKIKFLNPFVINVAAAVIIILIVVSGIFIYNKSLNNDQLYNKFYTKYPSVSISRSLSDNDSQKLVQKAFLLYDKNDFKNASILFNKLLENDQSNYKDMFYLAICEQEQNNLKTSEKYLNILIKEKDQFYWEQAHWYLALNYIKLGDRSKAKEILKVIVKENMSNKEEAKKLLKKLT